jgi:hypothetical protein
MLPLCLTSCEPVSLGGSGNDAGSPPAGGSTSTGGSPGVGGSSGSGGSGPADAPVLGGPDSGGTGDSGTCPPRTFEADCAFGVASYTCVASGGGWEWTYTCPDAPDAGLQHPYASTGAACINYPVSGYRVFPYDPSIRGGRGWPSCTLNCATVRPSYGISDWPLDQALPAGACDDEGATCEYALNGWCPPCAEVGGPGNGYTCVCRGHNWHCAVTSQGMNQCGGPTCLDPSLMFPTRASCATTTWTATQVCTCDVCGDLCDSEAQCPSGRCKPNQVCRPSSDKCQGPDECPATCRGLCEPEADGGSVDGGPAKPTDAAGPTGCDVAKAAQAVSSAGLVTVSVGQTLDVSLPSDLASSANWGVKEVECREGGYDLSAVAGKTVCLVSFATTTVCQDQPTDAWVVMSDGIVRCIYQAVRPGSDSAPGVYSVHDSLCSAPDAGVPACPGTNPAARTCRNTTSECIPSSCTCGSNGTWGCTEDCRLLPLCNADGGTAAVRM